jgi:hypothetical protein
VDVDSVVVVVVDVDVDSVVVVVIIVDVDVDAEFVETINDEHMLGQEFCIATNIQLLNEKN